MLALGIFEQDVNEHKSILYPRLYTPGLRNKLFNKKEFFRSAVHGSLAAFVLFFIPYGKIMDIFINLFLFIRDREFGQM